MHRISKSDLRGMSKVTSAHDKISAPHSRNIYFFWDGWSFSVPMVNLKSNLDAQKRHFNQVIR
jgi:hypothetical protein